MQNGDSTENIAAVDNNKHPGNKLKWIFHYFHSWMNIMEYVGASECLAFECSLQRTYRSNAIIFFYHYWVVNVGSCLDGINLFDFLAHSCAAIGVRYDYYIIYTQCVAFFHLVFFLLFNLFTAPKCWAEWKCQRITFCYVAIITFRVRTALGEVRRTKKSSVTKIDFVRCIQQSHQPVATPSPVHL